MKSLYFLTLALLTTCFFPVNAQDFTRVNPSHSTGKVLDIKMDPSGTGYAMVSCGYLMYTQDFGENWNEKPANLDVIALKIMPGSEGKKLVMYSTNRMYISTDSGDTFTDITAPNGGLFNNIAILENGNIIIPMRSGAVFITEDEGVNWTMITENVENGSPFTIDFIDNQNGWVASTSGDVWRTSDGGLHWTQIHTDDDTETYFHMLFSDINTGYRSVTSNKLYKTLDGGVTWNVHYEGLSFFNDFLILNDTTLFSFIGIIKSISRDGGATWDQYERDVSPLYQAVSAMNENELWRCGLNKSIQYSADQGETWTDQTNTFKTNLYDIAFLDANVGAAVGDTGMLLYTTDAGSTWDVIPTGTVKSISGVAFTKDGALLVTGSSLGIVKSTDLINFEEIWREVNFSAKLSHSSDGSMLYQHGQTWVLASSDQGDTWSVILEDQSRSFRKFSAGTNQALFVGTSKGDIHKTLDGGQTWETFSTGSTRFVRGMHFFDDQFGYVYSADSIRVTYDGCQTFTGLSVAAQSGIKMIMENDSTGWITSSSGPGSNQGLVYQTTNGWKTYSLVYSSCQGLSAMSLNPETGDMWFAGSGGNIETSGSVVSSVFSRPDFAAIPIAVYPNPSSGFIHIDFPEDFVDKNQITVYTISGVTVGIYSVGELKSSGMHLDAGIYIVSVTNGKSVGVAKVIITQ